MKNKESFEKTNNELLIKELEAKLKMTLNKLGSEKYGKTITKFTHRLKAGYPNLGYSDFIKYRLWHVLGNSTVNSNDCPYFDFSGEYSIQKFIEGL